MYPLILPKANANPCLTINMLAEAALESFVVYQIMAVKPRLFPLIGCLLIMGKIIK